MLESCVFVLEKDRKRKEEGRLEIVFLQRHFYGPTGPCRIRAWWGFFVYLLTGVNAPIRQKYGAVDMKMQLHGTHGAKPHLDGAIQCCRQHISKDACCMYVKID